MCGFLKGARANRLSEKIRERAISQAKRRSDGAPTDPVYANNFAGHLLMESEFHKDNEKYLARAKDEFFRALKLDPDSEVAISGLCYCDYNIAFFAEGQERRNLLSSAYKYGLKILEKKPHSKSAILLTYAVLEALSMYMPRTEGKEILELARTHIEQIKWRFPLHFDRDVLLQRFELSNLMRTDSDVYDKYSILAQSIENNISKMTRANGQFAPFEERILSTLMTDWIVCLCAMAKNSDDKSLITTNLDTALEKAHYNLALVGETKSSLCSLAEVMAVRFELGDQGFRNVKLQKLDDLTKRIKELALYGSFHLAMILSSIGRDQEAMDELRKLAADDDLYPLDVIMTHKSFAHVRARTDYKKFIENQLERMGQEWAA